MKLTGLVSTFFPAAFPIFAGDTMVQWGQPREPGGWGMGPGPMGWGMMAWFGPIMMIIFWAAIIIAVVLAIRWLLRAGTHAASGAHKDSALDILKERYARGEIDREEFEQKRRDLS